MSACYSSEVVPIEAGVSAVRRGLDIVVSLIALVAALPLLFVIALAIRLTSRGPILFHQQRVGEGGSIFTLHKFRTMTATSSGPEFTLPGDPRTTRVGRFLRAGHLDELPQLGSVLRGKMTLVGPRPETPALAERYPPELRPVLGYRPGMTGPCQVFMERPSPPPARTPRRSTSPSWCRVAWPSTWNSWTIQPWRQRSCCWQQPWQWCLVSGSLGRLRLPDLA